MIRVGDPLGGAGRGDRARARPDHPVGQGLGRARPRRRLPAAGAALRLPAAPRPDRGGDGDEGDRRHARPASSILLDEGIGDTIRVSLTPKPGDGREEVQVAQQILQSMGLRSFPPQVTACPGCGRTTSTFFQDMAEEITDAPPRPHARVEARTHPGVEEMKVAVMGCVVNGPGESKHANIGISLPGTFEEPMAPVYVDGRLDRPCAATPSSRNSSRSSRTTSTADTAPQRPLRPPDGRGPRSPRGHAG